MTASKNELLTISEISFILYDATNPEYLDENVWHPGLKKTDILKISQKTGLILFQGNEQTGYQHILMRHNSVSTIPFWTETGSLQNQSRFGFGQIPFHYLSIAEDIFKPEYFQDTEKGQFDVYIGEHLDYLNQPKTFKLILYKDTSIIHTFYPAKTYSAKKLKDFPFVKNVIKASEIGVNHECLFSIKYSDFQNRTRAIVSVVSKRFEKLEIFSYQLYSQSGIIIKTVKFSETKKVDFVELHDRASMLMYTEDLSLIEKAIRSDLKVIDKIIYKSF